MITAGCTHGAVLRREGLSLAAGYANFPARLMKINFPESFARQQFLPNRSTGRVMSFFLKPLVSRYLCTPARTLNAACREAGRDKMAAPVRIVRCAISALLTEAVKSVRRPIDLGRLIYLLNIGFLSLRVVTRKGGRSRPHFLRNPDQWPAPLLGRGPGYEGNHCGL